MSFFSLLLSSPLYLFLFCIKSQRPSVSWMLLSPQYTENQIIQMGDDWDLQAVVRGCCSSSATAASPPIMDDSFFGLPDWGFQEPDNTTTNNMNNMFCFPDLSETKIAMEELELLCKPFLPRFELPISPLCNPTPPTLQQVKTEHHQQQPQQQQQQPRRSISHRPKRRKNQQKKVVCQVPAEGLSSDMWAWRKYGQKPIKGSPYPRGYYRCSSSKGCLARKQVERSRVDPQMFIVTYTAEHNHPVPTHRNSLAGSTRHKVVSNTSLKVPSTTSPPPMGLSPLTPSTEEDDEHIIKQEEGEVEEDDDDDLGISKLQELMSDDLFMELDQLVGNTSTPPESDPPVSAFDDCFVSPHWFSAATSATAAGGV